jgi:site-specific DNA recombinase
MDSNNRKYIPPLVSSNRLKEFVPPIDATENDLPIGGYIRVSTKKDEQKTSIENQKLILKEWADINGYGLVDIYIDVKSGGYIQNRDDMNRLKQDVKAGRIKGLLAKEISRTSRDVMDILELKRGLQDYGAFFLSMKESYDSRTDDDEFLLVIHAGLAQKERKTTASRVKMTQLKKARDGKTNVPSPAYGYRLSKDKQHIEIDPDTAPVYKMIVEKFLGGWGQLKICQWLTQQGIRSKRSDKWNTNSVKTILTNPVYLGITIYNATTLVRDSSGNAKRVVRPETEWIIRHNTHEPLITEEQFDRIQEIVKGRREKDKREWSCTKKYLLSGLLYCKVCKGKVYGYKSVDRREKRRTAGKTYYNYVDQNRYGRCDTPSKYWNMQKVDELAMQEIKKFFGDRDLINKRIKTKQYLYNRNLVNERLERERLQVELNKVTSAIKKQQEAYEEDLITKEDYRSRMNELREKKNAILEKIDSLNSRLEKVDSIEQRFHEISDKVLKIIDNIENLDFETKGMLLGKIVKRIFIGADYTLDIEYTFEE